MKVAIDARWIFPKISGIGVYTRELIKHLALLDNANTYLLFFHNESMREQTIALTNLYDASHFTTQLLPFDVFSIRNQLLLPRILSRANVDVFHSTNYMIPFLAFPRNESGHSKCVATVHDVIPMIFPHHAPKSRKSRFYPLYRRLMIEVGVRADAIITDSRSSRTDVIKHLHIPSSREKKVRTIYCGVSDRFTPSAPPESSDAPRLPASPVSPSGGEGGTLDTLLYVGRLDPYKNLTALIKAFAIARQKCPFPLNLTIAGETDPRYPEARRLVADLDIESAVTWTGYLSDDALVSVYRQSDLLVHPSRYEGFGLQVVEAMACGLPVICSNTGSLPEVAGDAAIMLDPDDINGFAEKIIEVLTRPELAKEMSRKSLRRAAAFTWSQTARHTLDLYTELTTDTH